MVNMTSEQPAEPRIFDSNGKTIGIVDTIFGSPLPLLRVVGWTIDESMAIHLKTSSHEALMPQSFCRLARHDVVAAGAASTPYSGFRADFFLDVGETPSSLTVGSGEAMPIPNATLFGTVRPHYESLFTESRVLRRSDIYGFGPPTDSTDELKKLISRAAGQVLDFGCGNGDLVLTLREQGCDARGVELDTPRIHSALKLAAREFTTLYEGGVPLPFTDESFDWIVSTEVIEHIDDIETYVPEFHRLLRPQGKLFFTTPDISSIPSSYPTGTVPWHLLESTHVRFFTPTSLRTMLSTHFQPDTTYAIGDHRVNGWLVPGSIAAVFNKK